MGSRCNTVELMWIAVKPVTTLNKTLVGKEGAPSLGRLLKLSYKEDQYKLMKRVIHVNQHVIKRNKKTCGAHVWIETKSDIEILR